MNITPAELNRLDLALVSTGPLADSGMHHLAYQKLAAAVRHLVVSVRAQDHLDQAAMDSWVDGLEPAFVGSDFMVGAR